MKKEYKNIHVAKKVMNVSERSEAIDEIKENEKADPNKTTTTPLPSPPLPSSSCLSPFLPFPSSLPFLYATVLSCSLAVLNSARFPTCLGV